MRGWLKSQRQARPPVEALVQEAEGHRACAASCPAQVGWRRRFPAATAEQRGDSRALLPGPPLPAGPPEETAMASGCFAPQPEREEPLAAHSPARPASGGASQWARREWWWRQSGWAAAHPVSERR